MGEQQTTPPPHPKQPALDYMTRQIDIWNRTAVRKKGITTTWRKRTFVLILLGTFFGLLSQDLPIPPDWITFTDEEQELVNQIFAICSAISVALASYAGTQILTTELETSQIKARSTAEALTVQAYLYLMDAPPYGGPNAEPLLYERVEIILKEVKDIIPYIADKKPQVPLGKKLLRILTLGIYKARPKSEWVRTFDPRMSFDQYFEERVMGQINGYYLKKAAGFQRVVNRGKNMGVILGFVGVVMGSVAATENPEASMWIAFLSTASASIASYLHANKYEYLMVSYITTANQLELISAKHKSTTPSNQMGSRKLVAETETIFAMEHNAWISEVARESEDDKGKDEAEKPEPVKKPRKTPPAPAAKKPVKPTKPVPAAPKAVPATPVAAPPDDTFNDLTDDEDTDW